MPMEVKDRIINKISQIEDESFLAELETIISNLQAIENDPYRLSAEMSQSISRAEEDIKYGRTATNEQVMREMKEWVNQK